jgi:Domain of unknown function (DUF4157)
VLQERNVATEHKKAPKQGLPPESLELGNASNEDNCCLAPGAMVSCREDLPSADHGQGKAAGQGGGAACRRREDQPLKISYGKAAESARSVNALAYTVGLDIVFADGQYSPESVSGQKLLAYELTQVVQQHQWGGLDAMAAADHFFWLQTKLASSLGSPEPL